MAPTDTERDDLVDRVSVLPEDKRLMLLTMIHRQFRVIVSDPHYKRALQPIEGVSRMTADVEGDMFRGNVPKLARRYEDWIKALKGYGLIDFPSAYDLISLNGNGHVPHSSG